MDKSKQLDLLKSLEKEKNQETKLKTNTLSKEIGEIKEKHDEISAIFRKQNEKEEKDQDFIDKSSFDKLEKKLSDIEDSVKNKTIEKQLKDAERERNSDDYLSTKASGDYREKFKKYLRGTLGKDDMIQAVVDDLSTKAQVNLDNEGGGFSVHPQYESEIRQRVYESSPLRMVANQQTIASDRYIFLEDFEDTMVEAKNSEIGTQGEVGQYKLKEHMIHVKEYSALPIISQKNLEDSFFNPEEYIKAKSVDKFIREENKDFILNVNDGDRPEGLKKFVKSGVYDPKKALDIESVGYTGKLSLDNIIDLDASLFSQYQVNPYYLISRLVKAALRKLKDSNGQYLLSMGANWGGLEGVKSQGVGLSLLGRPVLECNDLESGTKTGDVPIYYGDFKKGYTIVDRLGMMMIRDNVTRLGYIRFYMRKRVGASVVNGQAIKCLRKTD